MSLPVLEVKNLQMSFDTFDGEAKVLDGLNLIIEEGQTIGIVGETGCGKSVFARSILSLNPMPPARIVSGSIQYRGKEIIGASQADLSKIRGSKISMIFQDPASYLNPLLTVESQMIDSLKGQYIAANRPVPGKADLREAAKKMLSKVRLPDPERLLMSYPHQCSGGMRQRVLIAIALAGNPDLLVADEPTTALDVTVQAQVLKLISDLVAEQNLSLILITHDLGVISTVCARTVVMYAGTIVETGGSRTILETPFHPYSKGLIGAVPNIDNPEIKPKSISGHIPNLLSPPAGCRFNPRCPLATKLCSEEKPLLREVTPGHHVACHMVSI